MPKSICKQGRDDAQKQRSTYWQSPIPTSFSHCDNNNYTDRRQQTFMIKYYGNKGNNQC